MFDANWERIHRERQWGKYPKEELVRWALGRWGAERGARVLDIGAGQGGSTWFLGREGFCPVPLDGSFSALLKARDRLDADGLPYQGVQADFTQLPFKAQSFDGVVDVVATAHNTYSSMNMIFAEIARVLKPSGSLFSVIPTNKCARRTFRGLITTFFEKEEILYLLSHKFKDIDILQSTYQLDRDTKIDNWIITCVTKR